MFNGYNSFYPAMRQAGLLSGLRRINWGNILTNTQRTLNIVNQAIPLVYQVRPIVNNAKTVFKIIGAVRDDDSTSTKDNRTHAPTTTATVREEKEVETAPTSYQASNDNRPNFFL